MIKCGRLASKNATARLTTTRTNTIGYIGICMYVSLAHTRCWKSARTEYFKILIASGVRKMYILFFILIFNS